MKNLVKSLGVAAVLLATSLGAAQQAQAQDRWDRRGRNDAAIAIGAGVLGLAVGAAIADRNDRRYYDRRFYNARRYVTVPGRPGYYYYYDGAPRRYYQDRFYGRPPVFRGRYADRGYVRGYAPVNRGRWDRRDDRRRWDRRDDRRRWDRRGDDRRYYRR